MQRNNEREYRLQQSKRLQRFVIEHHDGTVNIYNYASLFDTCINPEGTVMALHVTYAPIWVCHGHNLRRLIHAIQEEKVNFTVYREGFHANKPNTDEPIITAISAAEPEEEAE